MKKGLYILGMAAILVACNGASNEADVAENNVVEQEQVAEVIPNRVLTMEVDGMTCKMGCGGSIRKELKKTGGVASVKYDFEEGRETNVATISFDKGLVTVDEMVKLVSEMNNGQFTVGETNSEAVDNSVSVSGDSEKGGSEEGNVEISSSNIEMPNFLDIIGGLLL